MDLTKYKELQDAVHTAVIEFNKFATSTLIEEIGNGNTIDLTTEESEYALDGDTMTIGANIYDDDFSNDILKSVYVEDNKLYFETENYTYSSDEITQSELELAFEFVMRIKGYDFSEL